MKTALSRLVVSLLSLLTVVVTLATSLGKLLVTMVGLLTAALERAVEAIKSRRHQENVKTSETPEASRANLRIVQAPSSKRDELTRALVGLGFQTPDVKRFVTSLSDNDMNQDIRDLIKIGLRNLGRAA